MAIFNNLETQVFSKNSRMSIEKLCVFFVHKWIDG